MRSMIGLENSTLTELKNTQRILGCVSINETVLLLCKMLKILHFAYTEELERVNGCSGESDVEGSTRKVNGNAKRSFN